MATTPPQSDWPTQAQEAPTTIVENGAQVGAPVPPPVDPRRRAFEDMWPWLLGLGLLVIAGIVALWWFQYHGKKDRASSTPVTQPTSAATTLAAPRVERVAAPKVIGLKQSDAAATLTQAGLKPLPRPAKSLTASGTVIAQKPAPGTRVKRGSEVVLDVSTGKPAVAVPDVSGRLAPDAIAVLRKAGFQTVVVGVPSTQPKGTVVAEAPAPGKKAPSGSKVRLNISKGTQQPAGKTSTTAAPATSTPSPTRTTPSNTTSTPAPANTTSTPAPANATSTPAPANTTSTPAPANTTSTPAPAKTTSTPANTTPAPKPTTATVPDATTQAIFPAIRSLEQAGLHTQVNLVQSSQPAGRVISQNPAAQSKAEAGQVVQLNVSLGPDPAQMMQVPDVTGQDAQQAAQALQDAGFAVQTVERTATGATDDGKVVDEQPSGQAPQGYTIVLIVGRTG